MSFIRTVQAPRALDFLLDHSKRDKMTGYAMLQGTRTPTGRRGPLTRSSNCDL